MNLKETPLNDCFVIEPQVFGDDRGFFFESFNQSKFNELTKTNYQFVQDNHSRSLCGVLRGLHYQIKHPQGKLVRVTAGEVFDVAVDLRKSSSTFGHWHGLHLSADNKKQLWIPPGFAHGFMVLSESADFLYKTTEFYKPQYEHCIRWDDADIGIKWPIQANLILSEKDKSGISLKNAEVFL